MQADINPEFRADQSERVLGHRRVRRRLKMVRVMAAARTSAMAKSRPTSSSTDADPFRHHDGRQGGTSRMVTIRTASSRQANFRTTTSRSGTPDTPQDARQMPAVIAMDRTAMRRLAKPSQEDSDSDADESAEHDDQNRRHGSATWQQPRAGALRAIAFRPGRRNRGFGCGCEPLVPMGKGRNAPRFHILGRSRGLLGEQNLRLFRGN